MAMDGLFVQRGSAAAEARGEVKQTRDRKQKQRLDEDLHSFAQAIAGEIVLDESPHAQAFISPDERRVQRVVTEGSDTGRSQEDDDVSVSLTSSIATANSDRRQVSARGRATLQPQVPRTGPPAVDGLFARRQDSSETAVWDPFMSAPGPSPTQGVDTLFVQTVAHSWEDPEEDGFSEQQHSSWSSNGPRSHSRGRDIRGSGAMIDALFVNPKEGTKENDLATAARAGEEDALTLEEIAAMEADQTSQGSGMSHSGAAALFRCTWVGRGCRQPWKFPKRPNWVCTEFRQLLALPRRSLASRGLVACAALVLLSVATAALATGCEEEAPLGEFCVSEGAAQWVVAFAPSVMALSGLAYWAQRTHTAQREHKEEAWRHDGEAQHDAVGILEALLEAPSPDRLQYTRQVLQILRDFPDKALIQHKGCVALEAICRAQKGNASKVQSEGAVPVLLAALELHLRVREVQRAGLSAVACLAKVADQQLYQEGGIAVILASMAKFKRDGAVQLPGAMAIGGACCASQKNRKSVCKYGGVTILLCALERHIDKSDILVAASEALSLIVQGGTAVREHLLPYSDAVNGIIKHVEGLHADATRESVKSSGTKGQEKHAKRARELQVVLKSMHKLQAELKKLDAAPAPAKDWRVEEAQAQVQPWEEDEEADEAEAGTDVDAGDAAELQDRLRKWKTKKK